MYYTIEEVKQHNIRHDCWIIYNKKIYDITDFIPKHPGGPVFVRSDKDVTEDFDDVMHSDKAMELLQEYYIGDLTTEEERQRKNIIEFLFFIFLLVVGLIILCFRENNRSTLDYDLDVYDRVMTLGL